MLVFDPPQTEIFFPNIEKNIESYDPSLMKLLILPPPSLASWAVPSAKYRKKIDPLRTFSINTFSQLCSAIVSDQECTNIYIFFG